MRRGGLIIVILIGLLLILGAAGAYLVLGNNGGSLTGQSPDAPLPTPTEDPGVQVVVARIAIPQGVVISDTISYLDIDTIATSQYNPDTQFTNVGEVANQLTTRAISPGEPIVRDMLTEPGLAQRLPGAEADRPRDKAYPLIVNNISGVGDQLQVGDFVDVVATFVIPRRESYPTRIGLEEQAGQVVTVVERERNIVDLASTKTIIQRAQVLQILRPAVATEGTPVDAAAAGAEIPETDASGQVVGSESSSVNTNPANDITNGFWTVILAIGDQEIELVEFALSTNSRIVLVLRGAGDTDFEETTGVTLDLLTNGYGVPLPNPLQPYIFDEETELTGAPTPTPAPTRIP